VPIVINQSIGEYEQLAISLCAHIKANAKNLQKDFPGAIVSDDVLDIMATTPRHIFIPNVDINKAYLDSSMAIGYHQTISQPYIVALMTSLLQTKSTDIILEIGTGSGYQAAVLAQLVKTVYTVEIIPELLHMAGLSFKKLDLNNIIYKLQSGVNGWEEFAPYNGIIVTAAAKEIPKALIKQLCVGGKLVIPVEDQYGEQQLCLITKTSDLSYNMQTILPVRFVPLQD
jgi:protein-L-isoaspartate(D-aspartate) O-methyltransferase